MTSPGADHEIVAGLRASSSAALQALLDSHWVSLVRYVAGFFDEVDQAEDVAQDCLVRLWERRLDLKLEGSLRAFLFRIARNLAVDELRRKNARERARNRAGQVATPRRPDEQVEESELQELVDHAIDALPERRREVFLLVRHHGLSYREVAEMLDLAPQTVANHFSLALADLRDALGALRSDQSPRSSDW